jgi:hypothetical protein
VLGLRLYTSLFSCRLPRLGLKRDDQGGVLGEVLQSPLKWLQVARQKLTIHVNI